MIVVFIFSVACEWRVLIKQDKDNSLQFAKVFPHQILKVTCHIFALYGIDKIKKLPPV